MDQRLKNTFDTASEERSRRRTESRVAPRAEFRGSVGKPEQSAFSPILRPKLHLGRNLSSKLCLVFPVRVPWECCMIPSFPCSRMGMRCRTLCVHCLAALHHLQSAGAGTRSNKRSVVTRKKRLDHAENGNEGIIQSAASCPSCSSWFTSFIVQTFCQLERQ